jgi:hypothetical protein
MKTLLTATCLLLASPTMWAGDIEAGPAGAAMAGPVVDTKPATVAKAYEPKHKSVFVATANDHNPFWPIGWVKTEVPVSTADTTAPVVPHVDDFLVTSILLNEPPMAVINGKEMAEGEVAALSVNGQPVMVQLMAVQDGRVILRWQNQNIIVPVRHSEELNGPATALR